MALFDQNRYKCNMNIVMPLYEHKYMIPSVSLINYYDLVTR